MSTMNNAYLELQKVYPNSSIAVEIGDETSRGIPVMAKIVTGNDEKPAIILTSLFQTGDFNSVRDEVLEAALRMAGVTSCFTNGKAENGDGGKIGGAEDVADEASKVGESLPSATASGRKRKSKPHTTPSTETTNEADDKTEETTPSTETTNEADDKTEETTPSTETANEAETDKVDEDEPKEVLFEINTEGAPAVDAALIKNMKKLCGQSVTELIKKNKIRVKCMVINPTSRKYMTEETRVAITDALAKEEG